MSVEHAPAICCHCGKQIKIAGYEATWRVDRDRNLDSVPNVECESCFAEANRGKSTMPKKVRYICEKCVTGYCSVWLKFRGYITRATVPCPCECHKGDANGVSSEPPIESEPVHRL